MKYRITFLVNSGRLKCRVSLLPGSRRTEFNVGYLIDTAGWNTDTMRCKRGSVHGRYHAQKINAEIDRFEARLASILDNVDKITPEQLHALIRDEKPAEEKKHRFVEILSEFVESERSRWAEHTCDKFISMLHHVEAYDAQTNIEDMTVEWMKAYVKSLTTLGNYSLNKEIKVMRWVMNWAKGHGYKVDEDALGWSPKMKTVPRKVIFLEWDELMKVYTHDFRNLHHAEVRDVFCFCCFTGLRFCDVRTLRRANVFADHISVTTLKTGDLIDIPLSDQAKAILDRYREDDLHGRALPVCNNAEMNETLKEVARSCELDDEVMMTEYRGNRRIDTIHKKWELITTHCARRTFICNALMMGISAEVVMSITGHSTYEAMKPYIAIASDAKRKAIDLFSRHQN